MSGEDTCTWKDTGAWSSKMMQLHQVMDTHPCMGHLRDLTQCAAGRVSVTDQNRSLGYRLLLPADDVAAAHLVVYILDQPKGDSLHWVALLLKLCQQIYVGCTCGMQWAAYDKVPLLELFLQRQCLFSVSIVLLETTECETAASETRTLLCT